MPSVSGPSAAEPDWRERGDIILGWLTKLVIGISLVGVVAFDGVSIGVAHVSTVDDANSAALAASHAWQSNNHSMTIALQAAEDTAAQHGETVVDNSLTFDSDGTAHLAVQREATTLVVRHIHALRSWIEVTASGSGRAVNQ